MKILFLILSLELIFVSADVNQEELKAAVYARKLVNQSTWGVVSNNAYNLANVPFGNIVSFADGGTGVPYFYLTTLDYTTANYSMVDQRASLTVGQIAIALGICKNYDPQEPPCGKVTLSGLLKPVATNSPEGRFAKDVLFREHPRFYGLGKFGILNFRLYKLDVKSVYVVNGYKTPTYPSSKYYFSVTF